jgi:hypothetical protein
MTWHVLKGPQVTVRRQHCVLVPPLQLGPLPGWGHASQQLEHEPAVPPFLAQEAGFVTLHLFLPF